MPRMYIISGCNGAGKTTASYDILPRMFSCSQFVNSDEFAKGLSPFNPASASVTASRLMLLRTRMLIETRKDFCIETTLATRSLIRTIDEAHRNGYSVMVLYLWITSPELAIERVHARVMAGGHHIDDATVRRRYWTGLHYLFREYMPVCDRWMIADNTTAPFRTVAEGSKEDGVRISDPETFSKIQGMHTDYEKKLIQEDKKKR